MTSRSGPARTIPETGTAAPRWVRLRDGVRRVAVAAAFAAAVGLAAGGVGATPAIAATAPTISAPSIRTGFGPVAITGTAGPGATVRLLESASVFGDLQPAVDYDNGNGPVTTVAGRDGRYRFTRNVDSGFLFAVESGGVRSAVRLVRVKVLPMLTVASTRVGVVTVRMTASPNQPHLSVRIQRVGAGGVWSTVARGTTNDAGRYSATLAGQGPGSTRAYRAWVDGDSLTSLTAGYSAIRRVRVSG